MIDLKKKKRERKNLERLKTLWKEFPDGAIEDTDPPDFVVKTPNNKRIGIELTSYYEKEREGGILLVEQERLRNKLTSYITERLTVMDLYPTVISLHFRKTPIKKKDIPELAEKVIRIVENHTEKVAESNTISIDVSIPSPIRIVSITRPKGIKKHSCNPVGSGWVPTIDSPVIQREIDKKAHKIPNDRYNCDQLFLVIEILGAKLSSYSSLAEDVYSHNYRSLYEKCIILYDDYKVIELKVA